MINENIDKIYNDGERMIPFVSHEYDELIRHYSSHNLFKTIIEHDIKALGLKDIDILDIGFGTGYACYLYSNLKNVNKVKGVDVSDECLEWANKNFYNSNIDYEVCDAVKFLKRKDVYSYIVTRHVLEHIENGLNIVDKNKFKNRLCINVPYDEKVGNKFHLLTGIKEQDFSKYSNVEFFYEDLDGNTYDKLPDDIFINSIVCIASKNNMPKVSSFIEFPFKASSLDEIVVSLGRYNLNMFLNIIQIQKEYINKYKKENESIKELITRQGCVIDNLNKDIQSLNLLIGQIYNSKSWKVTKPIRKASDIFKKIK